MINCRCEVNVKMLPISVGGDKTVECPWCDTPKREKVAVSQRLVDVLKELATITSGYFTGKRTGAREPPPGQIENYNMAILAPTQVVQWMALSHVNAGCHPLLTKKKKNQRRPYGVMIQTQHFCSRFFNRSSTFCRRLDEPAQSRWPI